MADENKKQEETILIRITEDDMTYETDLSFEEVVFWLETLKTMMVNRFIGV